MLEKLLFVLIRVVFDTYQTVKWIIFIRMMKVFDHPSSVQS
ncbi:hypothetical protein AtDm6_1349 [Acetobacter tropicalis]|nr:hypothetical protein AtDm6_1349 [Acetobacter tropicalis]